MEGPIFLSLRMPLGRNRKIRYRPHQSVFLQPSKFEGYTLGYTKLTNGWRDKSGFEPLPT